MSGSRKESQPLRAVRGERGVALVMALLILLAMSMLSILLMLSLSVETKITGHSMRSAQALNVAEAGVGEALARIRTGDVPNNLNPRMVSQIFLAAPGSVPVLAGPDSFALATGQPAGQWLRYSTAGKGADVLTVTYKTDPARTVIYRYDSSKNPPVNLATGFPIFVVRSTGTKGAERRRVLTEVIQRPFPTWIQAAMAAEKGIDFSGNSKICGYNHRVDTPTWTPGPHGSGCQAWGAGAGDLPGSWSTKNITSTGSAQQGGSPVNNAQNQTGFYAGPWEAIGMTQAEFFAWVGAPTSVPPSSPAGIYYLDNNGVTQDQSGSFAYHTGNGEGLLYVDGSLTINGNFTYRGLIYVEGDLNINGNTWILGALIVRGKGRVKIANGDCTVLYSRDAVSQSLAKAGGQFVTLSWREVP